MRWDTILAIAIIPIIIGKGVVEQSDCFVRTDPASSYYYVVIDDRVTSKHPNELQGVPAMLDSLWFNPGSDVRLLANIKGTWLTQDGEPCTPTHRTDK